MLDAGGGDDDVFISQFVIEGKVDLHGNDLTDVAVADDHYEERHLAPGKDLPKTNTCMMTMGLRLQMMLKIWLMMLVLMNTMKRHLSPAQNLTMTDTR